MNVSDTSPGASNWRRISKAAVATGNYYLVFIILGMCMAIIGPTLPDLAKNTQTQLSSLSILFAARSLGYLTGAYLGGRVYDRIKGHPVMAITLAGTVAIMIVIPMTTILALLIIIVLALGVAESLLDVGGNTLLVWIHGDRSGSFLNGLHLFFGIGGFLAPVLVAQAIIAFNDFSFGYWCVALAILPVMTLTIILPGPEPEPLQTVKQGNGDHRFLTGALIAFFFLWVGAEAGFGGWIYAYALKSGLTDKSGAAYLTSTFWGAFTLGRLVSVPLAMKFKPVQMLFASLCGVIASLVLMVAFSGVFNILLISTIGVGASMASVFPTTLAFAQRRMTLSGKITSRFLAGAGIGAMIVPWIMGQFIESNPLYLILILIGSVTFATVVLLWICLGLKPEVLTTL